MGASNTTARPLVSAAPVASGEQSPGHDLMETPIRR
jgi:hypothetical protein